MSAERGRREREEEEGGKERNGVWGGKDGARKRKKRERGKRQPSSILVCARGQGETLRT